jgi:exopolysaccharide biosynthesis protein
MGSIKMICKKILYNSHLTIILSLLFAYQTFGQQKDSVFKEEVAPGIIHEKIVNAKDTLVVNILKIDLKNKNYDFEAEKAYDNLEARETASHLSKRLSENGSYVIAAVNADFFEIQTGGEIENNMITNGKFVKATNITDSIYDTFNNIHSQFAITAEGNPVIARFDFYGRLFPKDGSEPNIYRINSQTDSSKITLYNSYEGKETPAAHAGWNIFETDLKQIKTSGDTIFFKIGKKFFHKGSNIIPANDYVLSSNNQEASYLENHILPGDTIKALLELKPNYGKIHTLSGGWPRIVRNGENIAGMADSLEGTFPKFSITKHPRTGIGFSKDSTYLYLFTVDGRQESSSGISLKDFASLMISEGVYQGLNFDGGGSTTMVINGKVVNHPSDMTGERAVGSCFVVLKK